MKPTDGLSGSMEDYIQAIFHIQSEKRAARAKDIAARLNVNNSSVTGALRALSKKGYINYAPYDVITLTEQGEALARDVIRRHEALTQFFTRILCVDAREAEATACKMEHAISRNILDRMIRFVNFIQVCPRGGQDWIDEFWSHSEKQAPYEGCENCITRCQRTFKETLKAMEFIPKDGVPLTEFEPGQKGKILRLGGSPGDRANLSDKGVALGHIVEVETQEPKRRVMVVVIRGYHISLNLEEARLVFVGPYA